MSSRVLRLLSSAALGASGLFILACAPATGREGGEGSEDVSSDLSINFVELGVTKSAAPEGLTIITKTADYVAHFGAQPPSNVDFKKHWVLHWSMGEQNTGG